MMRRILIIWKIVLVILVVLACVITGYIAVWSRRVRQMLNWRGSIMKNMERKVERNAKRKIRHYNRGI